MLTGERPFSRMSRVQVMVTICIQKKQLELPAHLPTDLSVGSQSAYLPCRKSRGAVRGRAVLPELCGPIHATQGRLAQMCPDLEGACGHSTVAHEAALHSRLLVLGHQGLPAASMACWVWVWVSGLLWGRALQAEH